MAPGWVILMLLMKKVLNLCMKMIKIAFPESRASGEIALHLSVSAHRAHNDEIRCWRDYKKL
jgi:hypothetical protein